MKLLVSALILWGALTAINFHGSKAAPPAGLKAAGHELELIIAINRLTYTLADQHDHFYSFIGVRTLAMVHLSIHDIFSASYGKYAPYYWDKKWPEGVDPQSAAIESARILLAEAYPQRLDTINLACNTLLSGIASTPPGSSGQALGKEVARAYLELRANDGHKKEGNYTPMTKPGDYQYTPGNNDWVLRPDFTVARPFTLDTVTQFRSPPPPPLSSEAYAESYEEVKAYGSKQSRVRTKDQTAYAHWWAEFGEHSWNRIGRITARANNLPFIEANRMFALFNMALYDLYLASLESKYFYDTWRPYTAIRQGDTDGNPATVADPGWEPEMKTPPWPEYPSAHAAVGALGATLLTEVFGSPQVSFTMESVTALPEARERSYYDLNQAAEACADSRVMNGFHFRFATEEGLLQGKKIAQHTLQGFLRPE
jgi:hypothetical protein